MIAETEFLLFELAGQRWAVPSRRVKSVHLAMRMTPMPKAPALTEGVIELAGQAVPVLDLRRWLRLEPAPLRASQHFVVCETKQRLVALRVDRAVGLHEPTEAAAWKPFAEPGDRSRAVGALRVADDLIVVQDLDALLAHADAVLNAAEDLALAS